MSGDKVTRGLSQSCELTVQEAVRSPLADLRVPSLACGRGEGVEVPELDVTGQAECERAKGA